MKKWVLIMFDFKFDWTPDMETGYSDIDTQHKQLFKIGRDLEQLIRIQCIGVTDKQLLDIVCALRDYTGYHFYEEERIMQEMNYSEIAAHKKFHKKCSDYVMKMDLPKIKAEPLNQLKLIKDEVKSWIMTHVLSDDKDMIAAYRKYLEEAQESASKDNVQMDETYGRFLKEYDVVKLYLYKDQTCKGHLVAVFKEAATEMCRLSALERNIFFADIAKAAKVLKKCFDPDAICYMDMEDMGDKLVYHIIPKYKEDGNFGVQQMLDYNVAYENTQRFEAIFEKLKDKF